MDYSIVIYCSDISLFLLFADVSDPLWVPYSELFNVLWSYEYTGMSVQNGTNIYLKKRA